MATNLHPAKHTNWWLWGGGGLAILVVIVVAAFGFDLFGGSATDAPPPATEQAQ